MSTRSPDVSYRQRALAGARAAKAGASRYCIEGEHVTYADIAKRLGVDDQTAKNRMQHAKRKGWPVTWAALSR